MQVTISVPRTSLTIPIVTAALLIAVILGGIGGYIIRSVYSTPMESYKSLVVDQQTGYVAGSVDDQRILAQLEQSGYEGGGTVATPTLDLITGLPSGSDEDRNIKAMLERAGYEGGGSVVQGGTSRS